MNRLDGHDDDIAIYIDAVLRIYVPDLEQFKNWEPPKAAKLN